MRLFFDGFWAVMLLSWSSVGGTALEEVVVSLTANSSSINLLNPGGPTYFVSVYTKLHERPLASASLHKSE